MEYESFSETDTRKIAKDLGKNAKAGQVYALLGDLGVGKTVFTQGFAEGMGVDDYVNSPTFTILQEYPGKELTLNHFDVYRIGDSREMIEVGFDDYIYGDGVSLIEWANLIEDILPDDIIKITIAKDLDKGFDYRKITVDNEDND